MTGAGHRAVTAGGEVPSALRRWFLVHFAVDWLFAVPLLVVPDAVLAALGWSVVDSMAARGVAAALVAIGTQSLLSRNAGPAVYREMLSLQILWSATATLASSCLASAATIPVPNPGRASHSAAMPSPLSPTVSVQPFSLDE